MQRYVIFLYIFFCILTHAIGFLEAQDHWSPGTELTYWYNSAGEPSGAGSEVRAAAGAWNNGLECYSFIEQCGLGIIQWVTDEDEWDRQLIQKLAVE